MRILVPIDFDAVSISALQYALKLKEVINARIIVLHVIVPAFPTSESASMNPIEISIKAAKLRLEEFIKTNVSRDNISEQNDIDQYVELGEVGLSIAEMTEGMGIDLVVMGTRDNRNIFNRIFGTSSTSVLQYVSIPVVFIHENTPYNSIDKICFAFDAEGELSNAVSDFHKFNKLIQATTHFIHVSKSDEESLSHSKDEIVKALLNSEEPQYSFQVKSIKSKSVVDALVDYCLFEKMDMLIMVHKGSGLLNEILKGSLSMRLIERFHLPIMIVK